MSVHIGSAADGYLENTVLVLPFPEKRLQLAGGEMGLRRVDTGLFRFGRAPRSFLDG